MSDSTSTFSKPTFQLTQLNQVEEQFPQLNFQQDYPLKDLTYFKVGGPAQALVKLDQRQDIIDLVRFCQKQEIKFTILGGASNVIVSDDGITGLVVVLNHSQFEVVAAGQDAANQPNTAKIRVDSGMKTALCVAQSVQRGLTGLEYFLGVPGKIGGAVYNNAHYLQDLISDYITQVEIIDEQGQVRWLSNQECQFAYDSSRFHQTHEVILRAEFELQKGSQTESREKIKQATQYRAKTQPLGLPSSGCIFKNTPNTPFLKQKFPQFAHREFVPTGFLIDQAGLKGESVGDIEVSHKHAAFFVNRGQGTATDIKKLLKKVQQVVEQKYQVELEPEVFWLE